MKLKISTISLLSSLGIILPLYAVNGDNTPTNPACENDDGTPPCGGGECEDEEESDQSGECTPAGSVVKNGSFRYHMWATDFSFSSSLVGGCSPCGSSASSASTLPSLELKRATVIGNDYFFNSFGDRTGFTKYDKTFWLHKSKGRFRYFDPGDTTMHNNRLSFDSTTSAWKETSEAGKNHAGITLYDSSNNIITTGGDRGDAHTAILLHHDGSTEHYEIAWTTSNWGYARLVALMDRNGNKETLTYELAQPALPTDTIAHSDRADFFQKKDITDAYGRTASITSVYQLDQWVISQIDLPNGETLSYTYGDMGSLGNPVHRQWL